MLKNPLTYEIMTPESVGLKNTYAFPKLTVACSHSPLHTNHIACDFWSCRNLVLGKLSGRAAFQDRMQELGFNLCA
eukprot:COSAG03_NODE_17875_length_366_cov_0.970037_1_plen_76_part_00